MQELRLTFRHEDFGLISDRSSRQILRQLSKSVRAAQLRELDSFIFQELNLPYSQLRSLQDRLHNQAESSPAYFLERLEKGSLLLFAVASAALVGVLVKLITDTLSDDADGRREALQSLNRYVNTEWGTNVAKRVSEEVEVRGLGSHTIVERTDIIQGDQEVTLKVRLGTDPSAEPPVQPATAESIQDQLDTELSDHD